MLKKLLANKFAIPVLCLLGGMAIGAIFYPSKSITREETARYEREIENTRAFALDRIEAVREEKDEMEGKHIEYRLETQSKISSLTIENTHLKKKTKETIYKIIKPDGTIEERTVRTSDTEIVSQIVTDIKQEFNKKVTSIENKWKSIHLKRVKSIKEKYEEEISQKEKVISEYSKKETIKINERKFGMSLGYTTDNTYFSSITYTVFGPFFLDLHLETDPQFQNSSTGAAVGISF